MSARFKFGDIIENGWAADSNPRKRGVYLWSFTRTGRMNPGKHVKLLHDDGRTGELRISDDDKMTVVGTIFDAKDEVWLPIERADKSVDRIYDLPGMPRPISNSEEYWCRDADGRVFLATWADDGKRAYWWDLDGESPVDPVEFMPHPLDPRFKEASDASA